MWITHKNIENGSKIPFMGTNLLVNGVLDKNCPFLQMERLTSFLERKNKQFDGFCGKRKDLRI